MRRPFLLFILLLATYCWLKDLVGILFYLRNATYANFYGSIAGAIGVLLFLYLLKKVIFKNTPSLLKELFRTDRKNEWPALLVACLPVILLGLIRSIYPDQNADTGHFELYLQDYGFPENKTNYAVGSLRTYYTPLPERMFAAFRHILGYRMGAIFNTLLLVTLLATVYDFLKKFLSLYKPDFRPRPILLALAALFVITADNTLFCIGTYKPDLIGIPFILEMVYIVFLNDNPRKTREHLYFFLITSLVLCFKLTYLPFIGILGLIYYFRYWKNFSSAGKILFPLSILIFPSIYYLYNYLETGSPIFPFYNTVFHSPLYPNSNFKDARFGTKAFYEIFIFPIATFLNKSRCNEFALYSYRLLFGYFFAWGTVIYCLLQLRKNKSGILQALLGLSLLALAFDYAVVLTTGYFRYGIIVEILYGIILILWLFHRPVVRWVTGPLILVLIAFQSYHTIDNIYIKQINLSWHDYQHIFTDKTMLKRNISLIFHDYPGSTIKDEDNILPKIDAFFIVGPYVDDSFDYLLKRTAPVYDILYFARTKDSVRKFEQDIVRPLTKTKIVGETATWGSLMDHQVRGLNDRGYLVTEIHVLYPSFFKAGEPFFFLRAESVDTSLYVIKYTQKLVTDEKGPDSEDSLNYTSKNKMKNFVLEAPYIFDRTYLPSNYDVTINGVRHIVADRFRNIRIFTSDSSTLTVKRHTILPFEVIIQEVEEKQKNK